MPYKEFEPKDSLEACLTKLWGDTREVNPTTRLEEIICKIADAQPTGIHAVPDIGATDVGKVLTAGEDGAVWGAGGSYDAVIILEETDGDFERATLTSGNFSDVLQKIIDGDIPKIGIISPQYTVLEGKKRVVYFINAVSAVYDTPAPDVPYIYIEIFVPSTDAKFFLYWTAEGIENGA